MLKRQRQAAISVTEFRYQLNEAGSRILRPSFSILMKKRIFTCICLSGLFCLSSKSQDVIRQVSCNDDFIAHQVDSVKEDFSRKGYIVVKEASMTMESQYKMPIIVPLTEGTWYQFVFIGDISSRLYEVRMYDWNERQVVYKKNQWGDVDGNIISYLYIPQASEFHLIKPLQINKKKKQMCGYVMLLKRVK